MNTISTAVQKPVPKPDRDVAPSPHPAGDLQALPDAAVRGAFDLVLRAVSGGTPAARPETDGGEMDEPEGATGEDRRPEAGASPAPPPSPGDPGSAAAALAEILSAAVLSARPELPAGHGTGAPGPAPSAASPAGPDAAPETSLVGNLEAARADASPRAGPSPGTLLQGGPPQVEVLDRAVHFKPILPEAARHALPAAAAATSALPAVPNAADAQPRPVRPGPVAPAVAGPDPAPIAPAAQIAAQIAAQVATQIAGTVAGKVNAAPPKATVALATDPEPRAGDASARADASARTATGIDGPGGLTAREDNRSRSGIAGLLLAPTGRQGPPGVPIPGPGNGSGTEPARLAAVLPTIAAAITEEIERATAAGPERRVGADPAIPAAQDGPLRVLKIQLRPESLGIVTVELRLVDGQLETHLRAARPETAAMLQRDSAILTELLKHAHYRPEIIVEPVRPGDAGFSAGGSPSQGQSGLTDGGARPGHGGDGQRQADQRAAQRPTLGRRDGERTDETVRPRDGGVYL
ncbi:MULTISPECIES: flagellar hook-length control protein FliK [Methylobacterium]|uniref:flagellar hook-length control protein FliK n=1 Tax=Methylobacterium TaxID=407 RepID=UPI00038031B5|nr:MULTISPECIES: flagellar hook-length control protein FliK [unclassified Methylobacterium]MBN4095214.1 flagellar hook-length control protein FliK [Methylobacterium sp. OT2]